MRSGLVKASLTGPEVYRWIEMRRTKLAGGSTQHALWDYLPRGVVGASVDTYMGVEPMGNLELAVPVGLEQTQDWPTYALLAQAMALLPKSLEDGEQLLVMHHGPMEITVG